MGTLVGHVVPGFGFFVIGLWHFYNHIKDNSAHPNRFKSKPWFPAPFLRHLELYFIMVGTTISIAMELFIGPVAHQPLDVDGTIPSNHLHNFEHASISASFFVYAMFAIILDTRTTGIKTGITQLLAGVAFAQQLLLFHLHSADHMGVEGQYHFLLQFVIFVSLACTLLGLGFEENFLIGYVRSLSVTFQGIWFIVMGFMLWTPELIPKGCHMNMEDGHYVVRCHDLPSLHRAKALVNIEFSWYLAGFMVVTTLLYLLLDGIYRKETGYKWLQKYETDSMDMQS